MTTTRVLMVCSGNICRSPTAEAVLRDLAPELDVDSAGTGGWHVGEAPDPRSTEAAARRGLTLTGPARQVSAADFDAFDLILSVDAENLARLRRIAPPGARAAVRLLDDVDVPDPYYGGPDGFDDVLDQVTRACERLVAELRGTGLRGAGLRGADVPQG